MPEPAAIPSGEPRSVTFDGILDGRIGAELALRDANRALDGFGVGRFSCSVDGGRFSLLPEGRPFPGGGFGQDRQAEFLAALAKVIDAAVPGSVESTLRCRALYDEHVVETLFRVDGRRVDPLSRVRPRTADDAPPEVTEIAVGARFGLGRRQASILAVLLLVGGGLAAWQSGLLDRILSARAEAIATGTGPFGNLLQLGLQRSWGIYEVEIRRGAGYPADNAALQRAQAEAVTLEQRAAFELIGNGGEVWVQLLAGDGSVLAANRCELRPLLGAADAVVRVRLPGAIRAHRVTLSLTQDPPGGGR